MITIKKTVGAVLYLEGNKKAYPGEQIKLDKASEEALIKRGLAEKAEAEEASAEEDSEDDIPDLQPEEPVKTTSRKKKN